MLAFLLINPCSSKEPKFPCGLRAQTSVSEGTLVPSSKKGGSNNPDYQPYRPRHHPAHGGEGETWGRAIEKEKTCALTKGLMSRALVPGTRPAHSLLRKPAQKLLGAKPLSCLGPPGLALGMGTGET